MTRPGDGRPSNYVLGHNFLPYCIDNDASFVEPVIENWRKKKKEDPSYERPRGIVEIYCMTPEEHVEFLGRRDTHDLWSPEKQELTLQEPELSEKMGKLEGVMMFSNNEHVAEVASQEYELLRYLCGQAEIIVYVD